MTTTTQRAMRLPALVPATPAGLPSCVGSPAADSVRLPSRSERIHRGSTKSEVRPAGATYPVGIERESHRQFDNAGPLAGDDR
jgi:hypothetical protein